jgi:SAM-dependent methyltransferase
MAEDLFSAAAAFYDEDYRALEYNADVEFYVDLARESGGPVLEMGCGTGRILLPTARAGVRIHGVDLSERMLAELGRKLAQEPAEVRERVTYCQGDIRTVEAGNGYALATAPFRVVQFLVSREDQRAWLRNVKRRLAPGGALCFDVFQPNYLYLAGPREPFVEIDRVEAGTGRRIQRITRTTPHNEAQVVDVEFRWVVDGREEATRTFAMRWFTRGELENLLELEGFEIADYWGSFRREPFGEGSGDQVIRATVRV